MMDGPAREPEHLLLELGEDFQLAVWNCCFRWHDLHRVIAVIIAMAHSRVPLWRDLRSPFLRRVFAYRLLGKSRGRPDAHRLSAAWRDRFRGATGRWRPRHGVWGHFHHCTAVVWFAARAGERHRSYRRNL